MRKILKNSLYTAVFTDAVEGGYTVTVTILPRCISEGDTFEEARKNIVEAIELYIQTVQPTLNHSRPENFIVTPVTVSV